MLPSGNEAEVIQLAKAGKVWAGKGKIAHVGGLVFVGVGAYIFQVPRHLSSRSDFFYTLKCEEPDYALLALADQGDANCQADFAVLLLEQEKPELAAHWFALAAEKEHPDAMHHLSVLYQTGQGVKQSEETAMVWRSRAAAAGHKISRAQLDDMKVWG